MVDFAEGGELRECNTNFYLSLRWNLNILKFSTNVSSVPPCEKFFLFFFSYSTSTGFLDYTDQKNRGAYCNPPHFVMSQMASIGAGLIVLSTLLQTVHSDQASSEAGLFACDSHNDCSHVQGGAHACFFTSQKSSGFCFKENKANSIISSTSATHPTSSIPPTTTNSFIELDSRNDNNTSSTTTTTQEGPTFGDGVLIIRGDPGQSSLLTFGSGKHSYTVGNQAGTFVVAHESHGEVLSASSSGDVSFTTPSVRARSLSAAGSLSVDGFIQWQVAVRDEYDGDSPSGVQGWTPIPLPVASGLEAPTLPIGVSTECNVAMLGGPGIFQNAGSIMKEFTFDDSVKHVRILVNFHFIDNWSGQSGFMKVASLPTQGEDFNAPEVVWAKQYSVAPRGPDSMVKSKLASLNVCGDVTVGEHMFANKIDVLVPVVRGKIQVTFGSTWELQEVGKLPCSWGISGLKFLSR